MWQASSVESNDFSSGVRRKQSNSSVDDTVSEESLNRLLVGEHDRASTLRKTPWKLPADGLDTWYNNAMLKTISVLLEAFTLGTVDPCYPLLSFSALPSCPNDQ